jgi:tetratricopeptide (TPR) repeat protein
LKRAEEYLQKAVSVTIERVKDPNRARITQSAYRNLGAVSHLEGLKEKALNYYLKSLKISQKVYSDTHFESLDTHYAICTVLISLGKVYEAQGRLEKLVILCNTHHDALSASPVYLVRLGNYYYLLG